MHARTSSKGQEFSDLRRARLGFSTLLVSLICLIGAAASGQTEARWVGASGNWSDPGNWDIGIVPKNAGGATYVIVLDVATEPTISITQSITVSGVLSGSILPAKKAAFRRRSMLMHSITSSGKISTLRFMPAKRSAKKVSGRQFSGVVRIGSGMRRGSSKTSASTREIRRKLSRWDILHSMFSTSVFHWKFA